MGNGDARRKETQVETLTVGVLVDSVDGFFNQLVISELLASAEELGIRLVFYFGGPLERDKTTGNYSWVYSLPGTGVVSAIIVLPHSIAPHNPQTATAHILQQLENLPVYSLFCEMENRYSVVADEDEAIGTMVRHLVEHHGYSRFAVLLGPEGPESASTIRLNRLTECLAERGIQIPQDRVFAGPATVETGKLAARELLSSEGDSPDVFVCMSDQAVSGAISEFQNNGISVPQDISVVALSEIDENPTNPCAISNVTYPISSMAKTLLTRVRSDFEQATSYQPERVIMKARFIQHESCGCNTWNERQIADSDGFLPPDGRTVDAVQLQKAAELRHGLDEVVEKCVSSSSPETFQVFIENTIHSLRNVGDVPVTILDVFSTQWTVSLLRHTDPSLQTFINALFIDAFRFILQTKIDGFKRMRQRDIGTLEFYKNGNEILTEKLSLHESLLGIGADIPALGVDRAQLVMICPYNPELGEIRIDYRMGGHPDIPGGNFRTIPIRNLMSDRAHTSHDHIMVLSLAHNNATFGYLSLAISENQFDQYGLVQETLSHIIDSALTNDELSAHIRKLTRKNDTLSRISLIDEFTGLHNRRALYTIGKERYERSLADNNSSCFIFIDMDGLKRINDTWGHREGDTAIKALSEILQRSFRENDLIVRYGGDEFVIIMTTIARDTVDKALERLTKNIEAHNALNRYSWTLSASWGFVYNQPGAARKAFEAVIEESDINLYQQKRKKKEAL